VQPAPIGPNLVKNDSFETGSLSPWTDTADSIVIAFGAESGRYAVKMHSYGGGAGVAQLLTGLHPGTRYLLTGWVKSGTPAATTYVGVKGYNSTDGVSYITSSTSWNQGAVIFVPAPGHTSAEVWCWRFIAGVGYCDNISVRAMS
jgi:hypothetical protein